VPPSNRSAKPLTKIEFGARERSSATVFPSRAASPALAPTRSSSVQADRCR
jgi:hypothetical protein